MRLKPDTAAMTFVLALLTALGPLSTDMYLPSLPTIATSLGGSTSETQLTLSVYLLGFAIGQVIYGPVSDRIGRRPVILGGLLAYAVASALCALAVNIEMLIAARFVQALGGAAPVVLARAMVRDLYDGVRAGRELSRMGMLMGLVPAVAPAIGGVLEIAFGWRASFWLALAAAVALAAVIRLALPETLRTPAAGRVSLRSILASFRELLRHGGFRTYAVLAGLTYGGLFAFISGSSFVLQQVYRLTPVLYGLSFGLAVLGFISGTILAQRLLPRRGLDGTIRVGVRFLALGGAAMLLMMIVHTGWSIEVTLPMAVYALGVGLVLPSCSASAMMPFPEKAGAASSLVGVIQMTFAATLGAGLGIALESSPLALPAAIFAMGALAVVVFHTTGSARAHA
jgi:DHA1 family bicyclomycin/chloramphenicol resistance-like MFS transporter